MKIVIDANRVLAALIKDSTTREILFDNLFEFIAPDFILTEINNHSPTIIKAASITKQDFEVLLTLIFEHITIIPINEYNIFIKKFKDDITDPKDLSYLALCAATNAVGIWTHDPHFQKQNKIKIFTNIDMLHLSGKVKSP